MVDAAVSGWVGRNLPKLRVTDALHRDGWPALLEERRVRDSTNFLFSRFLFPKDLHPLCKARPGQWGYIDKLGKMVISEQFDWAEPFLNGLARVGHRVHREWMAIWMMANIDPKGKFVLEPRATLGM